MRIDKYLIINSRGGVTLREREPRLGGNEVSLRLRLEVPDGLFNRPRLVAEMKVPDEAVPKATITPEITDNIKKIIKETTQLDMVISIVEQEPENK